MSTRYRVYEYVVSHNGYIVSARQAQGVLLSITSAAWLRENCRLERYPVRGGGVDTASFLRGLSDFIDMMEVQRIADIVELKPQTVVNGVLDSMFRSRFKFKSLIEVSAAEFSQLAYKSMTAYRCERIMEKKPKLKGLEKSNSAPAFCRCVACLVPNSSKENFRLLVGDSVKIWVRDTSTGMWNDTPTVIGGLITHIDSDSLTLALSGSVKTVKYTSIVGISPLEW